MAIRSLSICTGGGGLELGLELACPGLFAPIAYVEGEAFCVADLAEAMEQGLLASAPVWSDLRTMCEPEFRAFMGAALGGRRLGLLCGGYPCQDYSVAGKQAGMGGDRGRLWHSVARIVGETMPAFCFFENVSGHLQLGFEQVVGDLRGLGYRVAAGLFTASEVGASHKRERLFILAHAEDADGRRASGADNARWWAPETGRPGGMRGDVANRDSSGTQDAAAGGSGSPGGPIASAGRELADGAGTVSGRQHERKPFAAQCHQGFFPPGPNDRAAWAAVLAADPSLEPAICRVADGTSDSLDGERIDDAKRALQEAKKASICYWRMLHGMRLYDLIGTASPGLRPADARGDSVQAMPRDTARIPAVGRPQHGDGVRMLSEDLRAKSAEADIMLSKLRKQAGLAAQAGSRIDRLRMLGNGVVPLQAAYAFLSLFACLAHQ